VSTRSRRRVTCARLTPTRLTSALCAAVLVALLALAWHRRWVTDDAFINFRVIDNLRTGAGPVFNAGERVEAFTSVAWVAILAALSSLLPMVSLEWLSVALGIAGTLLGSAAGARGAWLLWRGAAHRGVAAPLGLLILTAMAPVWDFASSGLETGLPFAWLGCVFGPWPRCISRNATTTTGPGERALDLRRLPPPRGSS
jgi:arabinofuranosyltransferase